MADYDSDYDRHHRGNRPGMPRGARTSYHHHTYHDGYDGADLNRARSSGHGPAPNINIYNRMYQDQENVDENERGRAGLYPDSFMPGAFPAQARRSRSRSAVDMEDLEYQRRKWKQQQKEDDDEARRKADRAVDDFRREEEERMRERDKLIHQIKLDEELAENERKNLIRKAMLEEDEKKRKAADERKEMLRKARQDEEDAKEKEKKEREDLLRRIKVEEQEKKDKEKAAWEEYERKKLEKEKKEKEDKEKKEKEYMDRVTKDFGRFGFTESQIQRALKHEEEKTKTNVVQVNGGVLVPGSPVGRHRSNSHLGHRPVYPKIHRHDVAVETLKYFDLDWEYDRSNKDFIVILHELDEDQTDELFEHTRQLKSRSTKLLDDGRGRKDDFVWIKRRGSSRGKSRDRSRHGGLRERFAESVVRRM